MKRKTVPVVNETAPDRFERLRQAGPVLKSEFIGIDTVIDDLLQGVSAWYLFSDLQDRPTIINLWGMTGVGKTSLVKRLWELLQIGDNGMYLNLRALRHRSIPVYDDLQGLHMRHPDSPSIILLDEFQSIRTKDEEGNEKDENGMGLIWQLLDNGKIVVPRDEAHWYEHGLHLLTDLQYRISNGVQVRNGIVVPGTELDTNEDHHRFSRGKPKNRCNGTFVSPCEMRLLLTLSQGRFTTERDLRNHLKTLDGPGTIDFLDDLLSRYAQTGIDLDFSKSLIIILGNIDRAYDLAGNIDPDVDPDEFHRRSLSISVPTIKECLEKLFRSEQIARLGNNHIIYPSFSSDSFRRIIDQELGRLAAKVRAGRGLELVFDPSLPEKLFDEGVYPSQGTRPVYSTINAVVTGTLGRAFLEMRSLGIAASRLVLSASSDSIILDFYKRGRHLHRLPLAQSWKLSRGRAPRRDDEQANIAVHEAGHALVSIFLLNTFPERILSTLVGPTGSGRNEIRQEGVPRKGNALARIAVYLGGFAAEKLVFGEAGITAGSGSDIVEATHMAVRFLKEKGFGELPVAVQVADPHTVGFIHHPSERIDHTAESWIRTALELAEKTLVKRKSLLLKLADHLSDNRCLTKEQLCEMVFGSQEFPKSFEQHSRFPFRRMLKEAVARDQGQETDQYQAAEFPFEPSPDEAGQEPIVQLHGNSRSGTICEERF